MENKNMTIANFNIVFGQDEEPLLNYFDSIVLPAFKGGIIRSKGNNEYVFMNIDISEDKEKGFILTGVIVKNTELEIKSKLEGDILVETNELHPSSPYSVFTIFLRNHRMALVRNQKGSPDLRSFTATVRMVFNKYIRDTNELRKNENKKPLPYPTVNIVGIPMKESIEQALKNVKKITRLTLKFYPLNGDLDYGKLFENMTTDLRRKVESKTRNMVLNSPKSKKGVIEVIHSAQGTIEPVIEVAYDDKDSNKKTGTIRGGHLSENMSIPISDNEPDVFIQEVIEHTRELESISLVSGDNAIIYSSNIEKIRKYTVQGN